MFAEITLRRFEAPLVHRQVAFAFHDAELFGHWWWEGPRWIDHLIRIKGTGTPSELADKIGMSERSTYEYIRLMKEFGAPVVYSRQRKSYYYMQEGTFTIRFLNE